MLTLTHQPQQAFENIVRKEEIARNKQQAISFFLTCFLQNQKIVSPFSNVFDIISLFAASPKDKYNDWVENNVKTGYQHFLLFPTMFFKGLLKLGIKLGIV